ncbi:MAG: hypothetical protein SFW64_01780 [Alphaproteobacteria bacterium]|nr:hypothetical protein [Alphaproteobacteria bacterium]
MSRSELKARLKKDTRTKEEIFQALVAQMKELSKGEMTDGEAAQAASNLIGFCSAIVYGELAKSVDSTCNADTIESGIGDDSGVS